ncbi:N-(5'-phosphoribosyl)anthranilate isomerase [Bacteroidales bacterium]|nr:N-(5'-phosphoribosyl)anthranilate isomerase [Bacteroidales bacterium]
MKIKVCGMKYLDNIQALAQLPIHMMGLIFYAPSPRYVGNVEPRSLKILIPQSIAKVGVFVNETETNILSVAKAFDLQYLQLHGDESPQLCRSLQEKGYRIIKAFNVACENDLSNAATYEQACDYALFDTKTISHGGSGKQFDWQILKAYTANIPFVISGGIGENDAANIARFAHKQWIGIDLNSKFETEPGRKKIDILRKFIKEINI